ncbi:MAG: hypothetical protein KI792_14400 [Alphaproteobacteria bacterium]|nr:hypothetical protein [Alphaproteobacteria bacterium SS10]
MRSRSASTPSTNPSTRWKNRLLTAAVTAMTMGPPLAANAQDISYEQPPAQISQGALIDHDLLDDAVIGDIKAQRQIIGAAAKGHAIADPSFDGMGLSRRAAHALTALRNNGDLPGAAEGQDPAEWWQQAEGKIKEHVADQRLADAIGGGILIAGLVGMGRALMVGNIDGNQPARRRRSEDEGPSPSQSGPRTGPRP